MRRRPRSRHRRRLQPRGCVRGRYPSRPCGRSTRWRRWASLREGSPRSSRPQPWPRAPQRPSPRRDPHIRPCSLALRAAARPPRRAPRARPRFRSPRPAAPRRDDTQNPDMDGQARGLFRRAVAASLVATAALAMGTLVLGDFGETEGRILLTTASISFFGLLGLPAGVLLDQRRRRPLAIAELATSGLAFLLALNLIWIQWDDAGDAAWKSFVVVTTVAGALTQAAGVEVRRRQTDPAWISRLALASHATGALLATLVAVAALAEIDSGGYYRGLGAVAVANVLLVALQPILRRMAGQPAAAYRFVCVLDDGRRDAGERGGRDFPAAVADAIRELEGGDAREIGVERR